MDSSTSNSIAEDLVQSSKAFQKIQKMSNK